jgi:uncharacterized membrane protein YccC
MDEKSLRDLAAQLHGELTEALRQDPKSRERLSDMMKDINRLIDKPTDLPSSPHGSLPERLERVAVQFEADHPTLAASARRLVDLLGEVGI